MGNFYNTKNDNTLDFNHIFTPYDEDKALPSPDIEKNNNTPPSPYIDKKNDNSDGIIINPDILIEINNFTNAETKATSKLIKKKKILKNKKKYSTENLQRKIKTVAFDLIKEFCNKRIIEIYGGDKGNGSNIKQLLKINYTQIQKMSANYNKTLLDKKIKDIFSDDISKKYTDFPSYHNKDLINRLLNEEDEEKKNQLVNLFNKTFKECIQHLRGDKTIEGLEGLEQSYIDYMNKKMISLEENEEGREYKNKFEEMLKNYENSFNNKKSKKKN